MGEPTSWRTELWHPVSVHFPIALLLFATLAKLLALIVKSPQKVFWQQVGSCLLLVGTASAWLAVYTGDLADGIVSRTICDPTQLKDHERAAYAVAWLFTAGVALQGFLFFHLLPSLQKILQLLTFLVMLIGCGYLIYASHLGAQVVYEQAGGVKIPASGCAGF